MNGKEKSLNEIPFRLFFSRSAASARKGLPPRGLPSPVLHILTSPLPYFFPTQKYAKPRLPRTEGE